MGKDEKLVTIIVAGSPHEWPKNEDIKYAEVVGLEVEGYSEDSEITYSVTYEKGNNSNKEGILSPGGAVKVKDRMVFDVSETGQS